MINIQFLVPDDSELLEVFGVTSEATDGVDSTRSLYLETGSDDEIRLTYDIPGRSIHLQWYRKGSRMLDMFREGAARLAVGGRTGETMLSVFFESDSLTGELHVRVWPAVCIDDRVLTR